MPYSEYRASIFTAERSPTVPNNPLALVCLSCGDTMEVVREIPKLEAHPSLRVLCCPSCNEVATKRLWASEQIGQNTLI
jgi:uncharacterized protein YbaR (Trm112 family)